MHSNRIDQRDGVEQRNLFAQVLKRPEDLLALLAARPGVVFTRDQLLAEVWGWRDGAGHRTVDSHIRGLRRKLGAAWVRTVHGVGYALEPEGGA